MDRNYIQELGRIAIGSRLKQLTEILMKDMVDVYRELQVDFEPRWFTFVLLLKNEGKLSLTDIARRLNQTHVAANQVANALEKKKLIESVKDKNDQRKRMLKLSRKGRKLVEELEPVWAGVDQAVAQLLKDAGSDLFAEIAKIENAIRERSMHDRLKEKIDAEIASRTAIIPYKPVHKHLFIDLNLDWLKEYFEVEPYDQKLLFNPDKEIIDKGGQILMVTYREEIIGTVALLKVNDRVCEMTKMALRKPYRGRGIGRRMLQAVFDLAKKEGFQKLTLLTSPKLEHALRLYRAFGFTESTEPSLLLSNLGRPSIQMEIQLNQST